MAIYDQLVLNCLVKFIHALFYTGKENSLVTVRAPEFAILGQTVHLHCNFTLPPGNVNFYSLKVFKILRKFSLETILCFSGFTTAKRFTGSCLQPVENCREWFSVPEA